MAGTGYEATPRHPRVAIDCSLAIYREAIEPLKIGYQVVARKK